MARKNSPALEAKLTAFRDISEECEKERKKLRPFHFEDVAPVNYIPHEADICASLGIPKPDFRKFNGGRNKKK